MPKKAVYLFVFSGFADWEASHAVAEVRRHGGYRVEAAGINMDPVESMGGIVVAMSRSSFYQAVTVGSKIHLSRS